MHCNQCNKPPRNSTYTALYYLHSIVAAYMSFKNCTDKALISLKNVTAVTRNGSKVIKHFYQAGFNFLSNIYTFIHFNSNSSSGFSDFQLQTLYTHFN